MRTADELKNIAAFQYIKNNTLKSNLAICLEHILFLLPLYNSQTPNTTIRYSIAKTVIVQCASMIEAALHYEMYNKLAFDYPKEEKLSKITENLGSSTNGYSLFVCEVKDKTLKSRDIQFHTMIKQYKSQCKEKSNTGFTEEMDRLREWRNHIHLTLLEEGERDAFKENEIRQALGILKKTFRIFSATATT